MSQSPAKRRKISENTAQTMHESEDDTFQSVQPPTTPTRASYLSPTKASLARSHPHLIPQAQARSLTEPRGKLLRNELLAGRKISQVQEQVDNENAESRQLQQNNLKDNYDAGAYDNQLPNPFLPGPEELIPPRSPLRPRQPSRSVQSRPTLRNNDDEPDIILPKLVERTDITTREIATTVSKDPELPPTPVQLGLDPPPERPRGLGSSSSPHGSKSGSGRRRVSNRGGRTLTSSPLKPKDRPLMQVLDDQESEPEPVQEAPESDMENDGVFQESVSSTELQEKKSLLSSLQNELAKLKAETSKLESAVDGGQSSKAQPLQDNIIDLLRHSTKSVVEESNHSDETLNAARENLLPYLTLFSPGRLNITTTTDTMNVDGHPKIVHTFNVLAPSPWPVHVFFAVFDVVTDVEGLKVESITRKDLHNSHHQSAAYQSELQKWINKRLESDLHKRNIGSLIWGMGQYFNECIKRAKVLQKLDEKYNGKVNGGDESSRVASEEITEEQALTLSKYLTMSQLEIELETDSTVRQTRRGKYVAPKILLTWRIQLNWTGGVKSTQEIIPSGITSSAQSSVQDVFHRLVKTQGIESAFDGVWGLLKDERGDETSKDQISSNAEASKGGKGRPKKRKRFS